MLLRLLSVPLLTRRDVLVRDDAIAPVRVWLVVVALSMLRVFLVGYEFLDEATALVRMLDLELVPKRLAVIALRVRPVMR